MSSNQRRFEEPETKPLSQVVLRKSVLRKSVLRMRIIPPQSVHSPLGKTAPHRCFKTPPPAPPPPRPSILALRLWVGSIPSVSQPDWPKPWSVFKATVMSLGGAWAPTRANETFWKSGGGSSSTGLSLEAQTLQPLSPFCHHRWPEKTPAPGGDQSELRQ